MSRPGSSGTNVRRVTRSWSWVAFAGIPLVLVMGGWQLRTAATSEAPATITVETVTAAGSPVSVAGGTSGRILWGQPADLDLTAVTCTYTAPTKSGDVPVEAGAASAVEDELGHGAFVRLASTASIITAQDVTCSGGGLTGVASAPAPTPGSDRTFGLVLLAMAPVLLGLGLLSRRVTRPRAA